MNHLDSCGNDSDGGLDELLHPAALAETTSASAGPGSIRGSGRESPLDVPAAVAGGAGISVVQLLEQLPEDGVHLRQRRKMILKHLLIIFFEVN